MPILKVFADKSQVDDVVDNGKLIERYDAFVVVDVPPSRAQALARVYPIEDITDQYRVRVGGTSVNTLAGRNAPKAATRGLRSRAKPKGEPSTLPPGPHHYVVQFVGPIKQSWLSRLRTLGATLRSPFGSFGYVVKASDAALRKIQTQKFVLWIEHLPYSDRLAPGLATSGSAKSKLPRRRGRPGVFTVEVFGSEDVGRVARAARAIGFSVLSTEPAARLVIVRSESSPTALAKELKELSEVHGVRFVRQRVVPRPSNDVATKIMGNAFAATTPTGLRLSGNGEIVAVCDTGLDTGDSTTIHPDFAGRVVAIKSYPITPDWNQVILNPNGNDGAADLDSGHGTHVAGSVLGNGTASSAGAAIIRGHAYKAKLVFQAVEQEMKWKPSAPAKLKKERYILSGIPANLTPLFQFAYNQGARIHSNSWGGGDPGAYDDQCRQFDDFVWKHKDLCFVIAAGNDGTDMDGDGKINPMSVSSPGTAKNCITVGACENDRPEFNDEKYGDWWEDDYPVSPFKNAPMADNPNQIVAFSSRGPTLDNRIKPEVVAPGTFILSTRSTMLAPNNFAWAAYPPNKKYFHMGGTSMATPLVAGAVALVREFLRTKQRIVSPTAALVKALLIAGAERLPGTASATTLVDNAQGFGRVSLDRALKKPLATIEGPGLTTGKKSTFTIAVPTANKTIRIALAYSDAPGEKLVNNLNLMVTDPAGKRFVGNKATSSSGVLAFDATNNVEVIQVDSAKKGTWTIDVIASNVSQGPQDFALAVVQI
jgi:hypothetical protein